MKTVDLPDNNGGVYSPEGFTRTEDGKTVVLQAMVEVDHATAAPLAPRATEATLLALKNVTDNLLLAAEAIQLAVAGLHTDAIAGTVTVSNQPTAIGLDAPTLAALENINATTGGLTDTQLRATAVPVSGTVALDAPSLAALETVTVANQLTDVASETTLSGLNGKVPALEGGRIPVVLPAGGGGLTDSELRAEPVPTLDEHAGSLLHLILKTLLSPFGYDKAQGRYRQTAVIESGTVTTVTGLTNIDGRNGAMLINANSRADWAMSHRSRIT